MRSFSDNQLTKVVERRRFGRRNVLKHAQLLVEGAAPVDCLVTNESAGGVGLQVAPEATIQGAFHLHIPCDDIVVQCRVSHRTDNRMGAKFVRSPQRASRVSSRTSVAVREMLAHALAKVAGGLPKASGIPPPPKRSLVE